MILYDPSHHLILGVQRQLRGHFQRRDFGFDGTFLSSSLHDGGGPRLSFFSAVPRTDSITGIEDGGNRHRPWKTCAVHLGFP